MSLCQILSYLSVQKISQASLLQVYMSIVSNSTFSMSDFVCLWLLWILSQIAAQYWISFGKIMSIDLYLSIINNVFQTKDNKYICYKSVCLVFICLYVCKFVSIHMFVCQDYGRLCPLSDWSKSMNNICQLNIYKY